MIRGLYSMSAGLRSSIVSVAPDGRLESSRWNAERESWYHHRNVAQAPSGYPDDWEEYVHVAAGKDRLRGTDVFAVKSDGSLLMFNIAPGGREMTGPVFLERSYASYRGFHVAPWSEYVHVFAGTHGSLYAIDAEGSLLYYRVLFKEGRRFLESTDPLILTQGSGPGSAWDAVDHASAGADGALYVVRSDGRLGYYRHIGALNGSKQFVSRSETTLDGLWDVAHFFAGDEGDLFGVTESGSLRYAHHPGWTSGDIRVSYGRSSTEDGQSVAGIIDRGWGGHERIRRLRLSDETSFPRYGATQRLRQQGERVEVVSEYAAVTVQSGVRSGRQVRLEAPFAVMFQNMQLFPDTIRDVFSDEVAAGLRVLTNVAVASLIGTAIGVAGVLLGPVGAAAGVIAAIFGGSVLVHEEINPADLGDVLLDIPLYHGAGRRQQLEAIIEVLLDCPDRVVGLSEMWVPHEASELMERVKSTFPYQLYGPHHEPDFLPGGLMILSRDPITAADSLVYRASTGEDAFSSKGVLFARVDDVVDVYVTHLQSDNPKLDTPEFGPGESAGDKQEYQATALRSFVEGTRNPDLPTVILGDFNLDATGGALWSADQRSSQDPDTQEKLAKLRGQKVVVDEVLRPDLDWPDHDRLVPFRDSPTDDGYAPTNRPQFYKSDVPARRNETDEQWEEKLGLRYGEQIDHVLYSPGRTQHRAMAPVRRLQWFVNYPRGQRQLSDHFGIRTYVGDINRVKITPSREPSRVTLRASRAHCLLESHPQGDPDQLMVRLTATNRGDTVEVRTPERDAHRSELYVLDGGPVITIDDPEDGLQLNISPFDADSGLLAKHDKLGDAQLHLKHRDLIGTVSLPRRAETASPEVTTRHWVGVIRGDHEAEYAIEVEAVTTW